LHPPERPCLGAQPYARRISGARPQGEHKAALGGGESMRISKQRREGSWKTETMKYDKEVLDRVLNPKLGDATY